jgi:hypothetical protein
VKKPVSKFAFQMRPAALHRGVLLGLLEAFVRDPLMEWTEVGLCTLNQVDP